MKNIHYSWNDFEQDTKILFGKISQSGFVPQKIVGVKCGGVFLATALGYLFDKPVDYIEYDSCLENDNQEILIVDCLCDDDKTFLQVTKNIKKFKSVSLFFNIKQNFQVDYFARRIDRDNEKSLIKFPWQMNID